MAATAAAAVTVLAIALGVATATPIGHSLSHVTAGAAPRTATPHLNLRERLPVAVSRSGSRLADARGERTLSHGQAVAEATAVALRRAHTKLWTITLLNLWTSSNAAATRVGALDPGMHVLVTGRSADGRDEIVVGDRSRWVTHGYLVASKPKPKPKPKPTPKPTPKPEPATGTGTGTGTGVTGAASGLSMAPCPDSSVENGLTSGAVYVYRSVCHAFPQITTYGGWDAHGEHSSGKALDIMTSDVALGDAIAAFLQAHSSELGLYDILWRQRIWTPVRASEGWRFLPSRGSATADHYDHVHVSVN